MQAHHAASVAGDDLAEDNNKLKTKVRRLYDIANVLSSLNLIMKVNLSPSRKPGFQWLGIDGICLHKDEQFAQPASNPVIQSLQSPNSGTVSEAASSAGTGSNQPQSCMQLASDSSSLSNKGLKRSAASGKPLSHKRSKNKPDPIPAPPDSYQGFSTGSAQSDVAVRQVSSPF